MREKVKYPVLEGQIAARGIKKSAIANRIGCTSRALSNKLSGKSRFTWDDVHTMSMVFFPDISPETLMQTTLGAVLNEV